MKQLNPQKLLQKLAVGFVFLSGTIYSDAAANNEIHQKARQSLIKLTARGIATIGDQISDPTMSSGTGFFIGESGYILTTTHMFDPLKEVLAVDTKIETEIKGEKVDVRFISEVASLDLVLLRAFPKYDVKLPPPLDVGHSGDIKEDSGLLTSGFDATGWVPKSLTVSERQSPIFPYAWKLGGSVKDGHSGGPVYIERDSRPLVVGVIKGSARGNDTQSLMIPIEHSFQLIGHFKMREMQEEISKMRKIIGRRKQLPPRPLIDRVDQIEEAVKEMEASFNWSAEVNTNNGSILVIYEKLISSGASIKEVSIKITPEIYIRKGENGAEKDIKISQKLATWVERKANVKAPVDLEGKRGVFEFPGIQKDLTESVKKLHGTFKDREPYRNLKLTISAEVNDIKIGKELVLRPEFNWVY